VKEIIVRYLKICHDHPEVDPRSYTQNHTVMKLLVVLF